MSKRIPSLRLHRPSKQGVVTRSGRDVYLGHWPPGRKSAPDEVQSAYERAVAEWLAGGRSQFHEVNSHSSISSTPSSSKATNLPSVGAYAPAITMAAALDALIESQPFPPTRSVVVVRGPVELLERQGFWPPKNKG